MEGRKAEEDMDTTEEPRVNTQDSKAGGELASLGQGPSSFSAFDVMTELNPQAGGC